MNIVMAEKKHIPGMLRLLAQVGQVHHVGRPDLFRDGAIKYDAQELEALLEDESCPIFIAAISSSQRWPMPVGIRSSSPTRCSR